MVAVAGLIAGILNLKGEYMNFKIGFDNEDREKLYQSWGQIFESNQWAEGKFNQMFEEKWSHDHNC